MEILDPGSLTDSDLDLRIAELATREKDISRERRLLHKYLALYGVDRGVQPTGVPFDGWLGRLVARENEVSYERSLIQARLDMSRAERSERTRGRSLASLGLDHLAKVLSRHAPSSARSPSARPIT